MKIDADAPFAPADPSAYIHRMPKGPQGQKRPADVIGAAIRVARIATGELEDNRDDNKSDNVAIGSNGGTARAKALTPQRRKQIAEKGAKARWQKAPVAE